MSYNIRTYTPVQVKQPKKAPFKTIDGVTEQTTFTTQSTLIKVSIHHALQQYICAYCETGIEQLTLYVSCAIGEKQKKQRYWSVRRYHMECYKVIERVLLA